MAEEDESHLVDKNYMEESNDVNADDFNGVKAESEVESESGERSPSPLPAPVKPEAFEEEFYPVNPGMIDHLFYGQIISMLMLSRLICILYLLSQNSFRASVENASSKLPCCMTNKDYDRI